MLLILFGLTGSGKNFVGNILASEFGYHYWDADSAILEEMQEQILKKEIFTQEIRDKFVQVIINDIIQLKKIHMKLVVSQALYKIKNRNQIALSLPEAQFIQVKASENLIVHRLIQRNGRIDPSYAEKIRINFEDKQEGEAVIMNNLDANSIIFQMRNILDIKSK